jgi:GT2 family glycosyltransferase
MILSVLVVSYETRELLERCLASLAEPLGRGEIEVIVADNASRDGSAAMVRDRFPRVRLIAHESNRGFSVAVNAAARASRGETLLLLNPDTEVPASGPAAIAASLAAHPDAWAVGLRQLAPDGVFQLSFGLEPGLASEWLRRVVQRRLDRDDRRLAAWLDRRYARPRPVAWVAGSSMAVRRDAFFRVGGFDEGYFLFFEDIDFCLRLRAAGGRVYYDPGVTVIHHRGASAARSPELASRAYRESQLRFWETHRGPWRRRIVHAWLRMRGVAP